ncbi:MAG: lipoprotein N-acyltransferase Lnb domain-containing protein, partial [Bacteriovorax sp.]
MKIALMFLFWFLSTECFAQADWFPRFESNSLSNKKNISVAFVSQNFKNPASMFGHTFLVFHDEFPPEPDALVVEFLGDTSSGGTAYVNAITSSIKGNYLINRMLYKILEYDADNRDIWIYELNLTETEKNSITDELNERIRKDYDYSFLFSNCSYFVYESIATPLNLKKLWAFPYTLPIHTIRKLDSQKRLKRSYVFFSNQHKARRKYDLISLEDKKYIENISELKSLDVDPKKIRANTVLAKVINYKIKNEDNFFRRNQLFEIKKSLLDNTNDDNAETSNRDPKNMVSESSIYLGVGSKHESRYNLIIKPAMRDFFSAQRDGLESSNLDISKLWLDSNGKKLRMTQYHLIKLETYAAGYLLSDSFNRYVDLSYYNWSRFTARSESEYVARFGSGWSHQWGALKIGLMPYLGFKLART